MEGPAASVRLMLPSRDGVACDTSKEAGGTEDDEGAVDCM